MTEEIPVTVAITSIAANIYSCKTATIYVPAGATFDTFTVSTRDGIILDIPFDRVAWIQGGSYDLGFKEGRKYARKKFRKALGL